MCMHYLVHLCISAPRCRTNLMEKNISMWINLPKFYDRSVFFTCYFNESFPRTPFCSKGCCPWLLRYPCLTFLRLWSIHLAPLTWAERMFTFFGDHVPGNSFARSQNSSANKWSSNSRRGIERYHLFSITKTVKVLSEGMSSCHSIALVILVRRK